jgi:hypothetical protein
MKIALVGASFAGKTSTANPFDSKGAGSGEAQDCQRFK